MPWSSLAGTALLQSCQDTNPLFQWAFVARGGGRGWKGWIPKVKGQSIRWDFLKAFRLFTQSNDKETKTQNSSPIQALVQYWKYYLLNYAVKAPGQQPAIRRSLAREATSPSLALWLGSQNSCLIIDCLENNFRRLDETAQAQKRHVSLMSCRSWNTSPH